MFKDNLPFLTPGMPMKEAIEIVTKGTLGIGIVVEEITNYECPPCRNNNGRGYSQGDATARESVLRDEGRGDYVPKSPNDLQGCQDRRSRREDEPLFDSYADSGGTVSCQWTAVRGRRGGFVLLPAGVHGFTIDGNRWMAKG